MDEHLADVLVAAVGAFGVVSAALIGAWKTRQAKNQTNEERKKLARAEIEITHRREALDFSIIFSEWDTLEREINRLFKDTCIDRFLVLQAWNGELSPKWTTAVFQKRSDGQKPVTYVGVEIDADYVNRLRTVVQTGCINFHVDSQQESLIKRIYKAEGVKASIWARLDSREMVDSKVGVRSRSIMYCSAATHEDISGPIPPDDELKVMLVVDRLRHSINRWYSEESIRRVSHGVSR